MKKYAIYALGNALVDQEIDISYDALNALGLDKGVMTLIDGEQYQELYAQLTHIQHKKTCGGSAANTLIGAAQLGSSCYLSCQVANDDLGRFYLKDLMAHHVDTLEALSFSQQGKTGQCLVFITPDADRTMNTFLGVSAELSEQQVNEEALMQSEWLYIEGYLVSSPSALNAVLKAIEVAKKHNVKIALSLSDPNMVKFFGKELNNLIIQGIDLLFCNRDEAFAFTKTNSLDTAIPALAHNAKSLVVTLGAEGSAVFHSNQMTQVSVRQVKAIDTNGAGDLFAGVFLHMISQGVDYDKAAHSANYASSILVTEYSSRLTVKGLHELKTFMDSPSIQHI